MAKKYLTDEELEKLLYESDSDCVLSENEDVDYSSGEDEILVLGEQSTSSSEEQNISIAEVQDSENDVYQPGPSKRMRINNRKSLPGGIPWKFDNNFMIETEIFRRGHSGITDNLKLQVDSPELVYFRHFLNKELVGVDNLKLQVDSPELVYFRHFLNKELVGVITEETNRYAETMKNKNMPSFSKWVNVNISEMYTFTALCILMGFIEKPALKDYWSTNPVIETPFFAKVCSRDRFLQILYALHFADNANLDKNDALRKIRPILSSLKESFGGRSLYPFEDLAIDESLILWKGRLAFKQYIPSKRHRFGVKLFEICDAETGYILDLIIYTGASIWS
ncbi:Transposase IS4 [Popillia japonica]|uniref:Transposase IS4 n=1 Tax=Popillia japonica TaxID=7064 RepID=A0AAW1KGD6_POPJA